MEAILGILAAIFLGFAIYFYQDRNKVESKAVNIRQTNDSYKSEIDALKKDIGELKTQLNKGSGSSDSKKKSGKKKSKKKGDDDADTIKKLKHERWELKERVKELTQEIKDSGDADKDAQRALVSVREEATRYREDLEEARGRIRRLEQDLGALDAGELRPSVAEPTSNDGAPSEREERLQSENRRLREDVKQLRQEQGEAISAARREKSSEVKSARDEARKLKRQVRRFKKRTENLHRVFLITRGQLLLVEDKLKKADPEFSSPRHFSTSFRGIDEALKMFDTRDARRSKQLEDAQKALKASRDRISQLEGKIATSSAAYSAEQADEKKAKPSQAEPEVEQPSEDEVKAKEEAKAKAKAEADASLDDLLAVVGPTPSTSSDDDDDDDDDDDIDLDDLDDLWDDDDLDGIEDL